jgi:hypothetical protein
MIVEQRTYTLYPATVGEYLKRYQEEGLTIQRPILGTMVGYFYTEIGPLNQIVHMWAYEDHADRDRRRAKLKSDPAWIKYTASVRQYLFTQENKILIPAPFSPYATSAP